MTEHPLSRRFFMGGALAAIVGPAAVAQAEVRVNIGINLPGPPQLVPVPSAPAIEYAPGVNANYFVYDGEYYVFSNGAWYASRWLQRPWVAVRPEFVPRPLLRIPVQYYRRPRSRGGDIDANARPAGKVTTAAVGRSAGTKVRRSRVSAGRIAATTTVTDAGVTTIADSPPGI